MSKIAEVLVDAKKLIDTPEKLAKGAYARNKYGESVYIKDKSATCFCALGAIRKSSIDNGFDTGIVISLRSKCEDNLFVKAFGAAVASQITDVNDFESHEELMTLFDRAIERAKELNL